MGRVVAIAGFATKNAIRLDTYAVKLTNKVTPNVLLIPTASSDAQANVENGIAKFESLGCRVKALCLITKSYTDEEMDALLSWADMIYVGGGDTITMMRIWKEHGLDTRLKKIYQTDAAVLAGVSAGANCWFSCGHSDSESFHKKDGWSFCWAEGMLDLFHMAYCPHYNEAGRNSFDTMLKEKELIGLALENDTAFVEKGKQRLFIRCSSTANGFEISYQNGVMQKQPLPFTDI